MVVHFGAEKTRLACPLGQSAGSSSGDKLLQSLARATAISGTKVMPMPVATIPQKASEVFPLEVRDWVGSSPVDPRHRCSTNNDPSLIRRNGFGRQVLLGRADRRDKGLVGGSN